MADDYLGRKMEDHLWRGGAGTAQRRPAATLKTLLAKNRECRDYDPAFDVGDDRLRRIIAAGEAVGAGRSAAEVLVPRRVGEGRGGPSGEAYLPRYVRDAARSVHSGLRRGRGEQVALYRSRRSGAEHAASGRRDGFERYAHREFRARSRRGRTRSRIRTIIDFGRGPQRRASGYRIEAMTLSSSSGVSTM